MTKLIHDRAIISDGAIVGEGTIVESNAYIGPYVKIGKNCRIMANVYIDNHTYIGDNCTIFPSAVIGTITQAKNYSGGKSGVLIGNNNIIREFATINATEGEQDDFTRIGDDNLLMAYTHVAHHCILKNKIIMSNAATLGGHVIVENNVILGGLAAVHQFVRIGEFSMCGGKAKIVKDIPPYLKVDGNPSKVIGINIIGLQRNGFSADKIKNIKHIFRILYRQGLNVSQAKAELGKLNCDDAKDFIDFIEKSERGILFKKSTEA